MPSNKFVRILIFYSSFIWFYTFGYSVLPTHLFSQGLTIKTLVMGQWIRFAAQLIIMPFLIYITARTSWILALICSFLYIIFSIKIVVLSQFYLASILSGFNVTLYYVFYNIAHFKNTPKGKTGFSSSLMFSIPVIIRIITPLVAGYLKGISEQLIWFPTILFFLIALFMVRLPQNFRIRFSLKNALDEIRSTRIILFLEGLWEALIFGFIPIYTLFYIKTPLRYGAFLSYIALISAGSSLILGHFSDKLKQRKIFLYPITVMLAIVTVTFIFATNNVGVWLLIVGITQFLVQLFWNVFTAFVVDTHKKIELLMVGREICLALGKFTGLGLVFLSLSYEHKPFYLFFILGGAMFLIGVKLFWDTRLKKL